MTATSDDYEWPLSLKANLELLAKLKENEQVRQKVIEEVLKKVKDYITRDLGKFATGGGSGGYLFETIKKSTELRKNILKNDSERRYETYNNFNETQITVYSQLLINNIFSFFGCLYYMYYECSSVCSFIKGGDWRDEKCDGTGGDQDLNKWLKDVTGNRLKSYDSSSTLMIKRDFEHNDLSQNKGFKLFPPRTSTTALLYFKDGDQLQYCLFFMLFLPEDENWNNAQSGHAVLFLQAFCRMVSEEQFKDMYVDTENGSFKTACKGVAENINKLLSSNTIVPVACSYTVNYKDLLDAKNFSKYIKWLKQSLSRLLVSLTEMNNDVSKWNENDLRDSKTFGPYPWGFTFYDGSWEAKEKLQQIQSLLSQVISSLSGLQNALSSISEGKGRSKRDTEASSAASTIGGVAGGLGAAGAAGAAAYSGVLGPVAESIGRFFKGLFI